MLPIDKGTVVSKAVANSNRFKQLIAWAFVAMCIPRHGQLFSVIDYKSGSALPRCKLAQMLPQISNTQQNIDYALEMGPPGVEKPRPANTAMQAI